MKVVVAPNCFRGGPSAAAVAEAMAEGVRRGLPEAEIVSLPLADGGDGTLDVLGRIFGGEICSAEVRDPLCRPISARLLLSHDGTTAVVEMAEASGLRLVTKEQRNPFRSSTYGTGQLIRTALDAGRRRIFVGAGGSATIDVGAGALTALGLRFADTADRPLEPTPASLQEVARVDTDGIDPRLAEAELLFLSDVATPLEENVSRYGAQKGVRPETENALSNTVCKLAELAEARGYRILGTPWLGAGGGLAGGFVAFAGARARGGAATIAALAGLTEHLQYADLLLTAEGRFDATSQHGKLPLVVAEMAADAGVPAVIFATSVVADATREVREGISILALNELEDPSRGAALLLRLTRMTERIARNHGRGLRRTA